MVTAIARVKDESDFIARSVQHMLGQVDEVIVCDNASSDDTCALLQGLVGVVLVHDQDIAYYQSEKMSDLAALAAERGADWVVPFDADEIWLSTEGTIAEALSAVSTEARIAQARLFDHVASPSGLDWRRPEALPLPKVACRALDGLVIRQGNHGASFPDVKHPLTVTDLLEVHHFPYRSPEQFIRKVRNGAAAYAATDLGENIGAHWRQYGELTDAQLREVFAEYFWSADPQADPELVHDPRP